MNTNDIPGDANAADLFARPDFFCPDCQGLVAGTLDGELFVGHCACGRCWYITPQRIAARYLTERQCEALGIQEVRWISPKNPLEVPTAAEATVSHKLEIAPAVAAAT